MECSFKWMLLYETNVFTGGTLKVITNMIISFNISDSRLKIIQQFSPLIIFKLESRLLWYFKGKTFRAHFWCSDNHVKLSSFLQI
jgi:hypothetical protein